MSLIQCAYCGKWFERHNGRKYCSKECYVEANRGMARDWHRQRRKRFKIEEKGGPWKLLAIQEAAREKGMTYGQFVAQLSGVEEALIYQRYRKEAGR